MPALASVTPLRPRIRAAVSVSTECRDGNWVRAVVTLSGRWGNGWAGDFEVTEVAEMVPGGVERPDLIAEVEQQVAGGRFDDEIAEALEG